MKEIYISILCLFIFFYPSQLNAFDFAPEVGDIAPDFNLSGVNKFFKNKTQYALNDFDNKWIVLYFYPKDFTTGCTIEAKGFSDLKDKFSMYNAEIIGISADSEDSHDNFCNEKSINYTLLSDPNGLVSTKYGSWIPPYSDRNTFLISPERKIMSRWISVTPINHANNVLNRLKQIT